MRAKEENLAAVSADLDRCFASSIDLLVSHCFYEPWVEAERT